jgi:hypothetical protein
MVGAYAIDVQSSDGRTNGDVRASSSWSARARVAADLPDAEVTRLNNAGHYLQEDAHDAIVPELLRLLSGAAGPPDGVNRIFYRSRAG